MMIHHQASSMSFDAFWLKASMLFVSYFTPIAEMIHVMLIFMALDTISGIWAALRSGERLQSSRLRRTIYKFIWYTVAVMTAWMMEKTFSLSWSHLASVVAGFICMVELKSIFENISRITGEPVFLKIIRMFKRKTSETLDDILPDDESSPESKPKNQATHEKDHTRQ
jgi:phage-related holin